MADQRFIKKSVTDIEPPDNWPAPLISLNHLLPWQNLITLLRLPQGELINLCAAPDTCLWTLPEGICHTHLNCTGLSGPAVLNEFCCDYTLCYFGSGLSQRYKVLTQMQWTQRARRAGALCLSVLRYYAWGVWAKINIGVSLLRSHLHAHLYAKGYSHLCGRSWEMS